MEGLLMRIQGVSWYLYSLVISTVLLQESPQNYTADNRKHFFLAHMCVDWLGLSWAWLQAMAWIQVFSNHSGTSSYPGVFFSWQRQKHESHPSLFQTCVHITSADNIALPEVIHTAKPRMKGQGNTLPLARSLVKVYVHNITAGECKIVSNDSVFHSVHGQEHIRSSERTVNGNRQEPR